MEAGREVWGRLMEGWGGLGGIGAGAIVDLLIY